MKARRCLARMREYCSVNGIVLNEGKTAAIIFSPNGTLYDEAPLIWSNGASMHLSSEVRFLGVMFDGICAEGNIW